MTSIERTIQVTYRHRVYFSRGVFLRSNPLLSSVLCSDAQEKPRKVLIALDESLVRAQPKLMPRIDDYFEAFKDSLDLVAAPMVLEGGERVKNSYFRVSDIQSFIERYHIDRHSYLIGVGGGALLDVVGLAAATAHRGVRHVRIPSTTLSQADSGVGVKNGINGFGKKNFVGTFAPPFAVINDFTLLASLPPREKRAGFSEAVKVALIRDAAFFEDLERDVRALRAFSPSAVQRLVVRSAELHVNHIATCGDPFEFGFARPLDFGHWSAHKIEQLSEYEIRHGEAVAIGIALDTIYSRRAGFLDAASCERILTLLEKLGFQLFANELLHTDAAGNGVVLKGLEEFREHLGGRLTVTLLRGIGRGFEAHEMRIATVLDSIGEMKQRHERSRPRAPRRLPATRARTP